MTEWKEVVLGDVANLLVGYAYKSAQFSEQQTDTRLLRGVNIGQGSLDWGRTAWWPDPDPDSRYQLADGDVVLAMDRPWIEAGLKRARIRDKDLPALLVQRVARLRGTAHARTSFIHHLTATERFSQYLQNIVTGATVPHISQSQIEAFPIRVPSLQVQDQICDVLDSLDDLIENNRRRVEVLEEMARAIYREWFVHFRYPGHESVLLVDSPLGPIPDGWSVRRLGDLTELDRTNVQPKRNPEEVFDHFSIPAFDEAKLPSVEEGSTIRSGKYLINGPAVMVSKLNPRIERTWFVQPGGDHRSIASTEFLILRPIDHASLQFLYATARSAPFQDRLRELSGGTSTSHQRAKPGDFLELGALDPGPEPIARFSDATSASLELAHDLLAASRNLAAVRDLLLPKLVTGQIDVSSLDLDSLVEGSVG